MKFFGRIPRPGADVVSKEHAWVAFTDYDGQAIQQMSGRDFERRWSVSIDRLTVSKPERDPRTPGKGPRDYTERFEFGEPVPGETLIFKAERTAGPDFSTRVYLNR
jgi:hypothetical protein